MKECGEIPANYKVTETPANFITPGNTASATTGNSLMVSTTATADIITDPSPTTTDSSADITESTKAINSDNFLWMVNHFSVISYSRAHTAHSMIHEVLTSMMLEGFLSEFPEKRMELVALQFDFQSKELNSKQCDTIQAAFQAYVKERASLSQSFSPN